ncbi:acyl carrier protein [Streptomyces megasporus]|uniref:acyl carrier protein n=1 Tax=Streptomyces megasporus TaxID=44060 RepID=UPI00068ED681|nr:acyl carrier protein [Streptomyces megasporus]
MTDQTTVQTAGPAAAQATGPVSVAELAALMRQTAGVAVDPDDLAARADTPFDAFGLDSLGLLGIVGELEKRHGRNLPDNAEQCKTPRAFLDCVNNTLATGA